MQAADSNDGAVARRQTFLALALIIGITAAVRAPLLSVPFERDEGEYAYIGWRLGHGELPYRDWIDQKPPAIFWIYRLALSLPDDPVRAVHLLALMWSAASACALFLLARQFMSHGWATIAAALFAVLSAHPLIEGTAANTEIFMLLPLILSVLSFLGSFRDRQTRVWPIFVCGASIGLAAAFKQVAAVNWPFLVCIYPFFCSGEKRWRSTFTFAALSAVGGALIWIVIGAYFHFRGGFRELVYNVLTHNLE